MNAAFDLTAYWRAAQTQVEQALAVYARDVAGMPPRVAQAMEYSLLAGGKRFRPVLILTAAESVGGTRDAVLPLACALEMIHTFSLVHDDLPAMDNDDLRRGKPTNHKVYGEAMAILAGDGLLAEAFLILSDAARRQQIPADRALRVIAQIAHATGARGMVGGQALDIEGEQRTLTSDEVATLHSLKTGALIRASLTSGALWCGANEAQIAQLDHYGACVGLAFQIADDLLSIEGDTATIGKKAGNDAARAKATYPAMVGVAAARARMQTLTEEACAIAAKFSTAGAALRAIAEFTITRSS